MILSFEKFSELARRYNVIPLHDALPADLDTPVSAFLKVRNNQYDFLFESVVGGEKWGRYSFLGTAPRKVFRFINNRFEIHSQNKAVEVVSFKDSPLEVLREEFSKYNVYQDPKLPRFFGGVVGYFGYNLVHHFDQITLPEKQQNWPDLYLIQTDVVVIFDNFSQLMRVVATVILPDEIRSDSSLLKQYYDKACQKIAETKTSLNKGTVSATPSSTQSKLSEQQNMTEKQYCDIVKRAQEYIRAGDIFQVVLSIRFELDGFSGSPLSVYRAIRRINPSPYMYYLQFEDLAIVGASPEVLVRLEDQKIHVRPIAGTRKRGADDAMDQRLENELREDPKERAEHVMLVDLGRNDVGRVAKIGTVCVEQNEVIERYSHVMHLVSHVSGVLAEGKDVFDVISSAFPAGTLSGAPKIRAMQIVSELENHERGIYGGAVGYISFTKNTDLAIAIRTAVLQRNKVWIQAGAGIVDNSVPKSEYEECVNKARAMIEAIKKADAGL